MRSDIRHSSAEVTVWFSPNDELHDGPAIEYIITISNGQPQSYQRTVYADGEVEKSKSSTDMEEVPYYVRDEVEDNMVPRGAWPN